MLPKSEGYGYEYCLLLFHSLSMGWKPLFQPNHPQCPIGQVQGLLLSTPSGSGQGPPQAPLCWNGGGQGKRSEIALGTLEIALGILEIALYRSLELRPISLNNFCRKKTLEVSENQALMTVIRECVPYVGSEGCSCLLRETLRPWDLNTGRLATQFPSARGQKRNYFAHPSLADQGSKESFNPA